MSTNEITVQPNPFPISRGRTKVQILRARLAELEAEAAKQRAYLDGLEQTAFGKPCSGCGQLLETELDFAAHFIVTDERYLNLGYCPAEGKRVD